MNNVVCKLFPEDNWVEVTNPKGELIAGVWAGVDSEPVLRIYVGSQFHGAMGNVEWKFSDLDIIQDNWNALQEMRKGLKEDLKAKQVECPWCKTVGSKERCTHCGY
jgi:hypothetical protein